MCGRFALSAPQAELMPHLGLDEAPQFAARYNITLAFPRFPGHIR